VASDGSQHARKSIASFLPTETDRAARRSLARLAKPEGDFELACELYKDALGNSRHGYEAYEQLAIYYEHKARDPEQAQQIVRLAINELCRAFQVGDITPGAYREFKARFDRRMERLDRKSRRPLLDALAMRHKISIRRRLCLTTSSSAGRAREPSQECWLWSIGLKERSHPRTAAAMRSSNCGRPWRFLRPRSAREVDLHSVPAKLR
jgi:hypothetical protein